MKYLQKIYNLTINTLPFGVFAIISATQIILFLIILSFMLVKKEYGLKSRIWYFSLSTALLLVQLGFTLIFNNGIGFLCFFMAIQSIFIPPAIFIKERKRVYKEEHIDLAKSLINEKEEQAVIKPNEIKRGEIDFTHLKSLLERLEFYPLSQAEKRQVKELSALVYTAENTALTQSLKIKINDLLTFLLKIMAKYGI